MWNLVTSDAFRRRFEKKFERGNPDACWPWIAGVNAHGYGKIHLAPGVSAALANRVALAFKLGRDLRPGRFACHTCDNPACVNPAHLYEGNALTNNRDALNRGRAVRARGSRKVRTENHLRGSAHPRSTLTEAKVREIRRLRAEGATLKALGARFGVHFTAIRSVCVGRTWRHVQG
jgi:hypothetical protein